MQNQYCRSRTARQAAARAETNDAPVTHDLAVVHQLSTSVLCVNQRLICQGSPIAVLTPENLRRLYGADVKFYQHNHG